MQVNKLLSLSLLFVFFQLLMSCKQPGSPPEPIQPLPTPEQIAYQEMEFNGFVHFNMNTFTNMEWGYGNENPSKFNPSSLDCDQWVKTMKQAGMKGVVITAKHHDGFCLWPSKYTEHSVKNSPWKNGQGDVIRELSEACKTHGLKFGIYLSPWDRNHADYGTPAYIDYFRNQLVELLTNYGEIFEVWFDGANGGDGYYGGANEVRKVDKLSYYDWENTYKLIDSLQPQAIIFSDAGPGCRWVGNEKGIAYETTWSMLMKDSVYGGMPEYAEQYSMGQENGSHWIPAEADVSIRPGWYYHPYEDHKVKSLGQLKEIYYQSVGRNSTLLLNLPVTPEGTIHPIDRERLLALGEKIKEDFDNNLMEKAKAECSDCRGSDYCLDMTIDGDPDTYWGGLDGKKEATLTYHFKDPVELNTIVLQEFIALGQRIKSFEVQGQVNGEWSRLAEGTTVGYKRILRIPRVNIESLRILIQDSRATPVINEIAIYNTNPLLEAPQISRSRKGLISMTVSEDGPQIHYTTDGSTPTASSPEFKGGIRFPRGGILKAISVYDGQKSEVSTLDMDIGPGRWRVTNANIESRNAIDENRDTWWEGNEIVVHLNENLKLKGFTYLPTQQRYPSGYVSKYQFYTSIDGVQWELASKGEFANIANNPITQEVRFEETEAAYIKFLAKETVDNKTASIAELGVITR